MYNPTIDQQKARIAIAMIAMGYASIWYDAKFYNEEPLFRDMVQRMNLCFVRCQMWQGRNPLVLRNKFSCQAIEKAEKLWYKRYLDVKKVRTERLGIYTAAYLEAASMAVNDVVKTCTNYRYRPFKWLYLTSQKLISWLYDLFGENEIYETGCKWYLTICNKIGRR